MYNNKIPTPNKLHFGTAGIPILSKGKNTHESIHDLVTLGLNSMEIEFVRSIFLNELSAKELGVIAKENDTLLSFQKCINFSSFWRIFCNFSCWFLFR
jgi:deoxyribonuclease-4